MNKEQLVDAVATKSKQSKKNVAAVLDATVAGISAALSKGEKVTLVGFGTFLVRERKAREGRNPRTGAVLKIAARKSPVFVPGKGLRENVAGGSKGKAGAKGGAAKKK